MSDAFEKVWYHGKLMDKKGRAFIQACEDKLGYELTITQGNYNPGGVEASAGTHDGGGVFDLAAWDYERKLRVIKDLGGWGWYRAPIAGLWGPHIHFGIINHGTLSRGAANQQAAYFAKRSGLVSNLYDNSYRAPGNPIFKYPPKAKPKPKPKLTNVAKARNELVASLHELGQARALLMKAPKERIKVHANIRRLEVQIDNIEDILHRLPKK